MVGLEPVRQNAEQQMPRQMNAGWAPIYFLPTSPECNGVEITQTRNLDVDCLPVRTHWTDLDARHGDQEDLGLT